MLDYFEVKENEVVIIEANNQEERKYLTGIATEAQLYFYIILTSITFKIHKGYRSEQYI